MKTVGRSGAAGRRTRFPLENCQGPPDICRPGGLALSGYSRITPAALQSRRKSAIYKCRCSVRQTDIAAGVVWKLRFAVQHKDTGVFGHIWFVIHADITVHTMFFFIFAITGSTVSAVRQHKIPPYFVYTGIDPDSGRFFYCQHTISSPHTTSNGSSLNRISIPLRAAIKRLVFCPIICKTSLSSGDATGVTSPGWECPYSFSCLDSSNPARASSKVQLRSDPWNRMSICLPRNIANS